MVTCKSKNVIFAMDITSTESKDYAIMNTIQKKLEDAGFTVTRVHEPSHRSYYGRGPNALANNYDYVRRKGIKNSIIFNLMNGVDPSNIKEAYQSDKSRGDGYWYAQQALKPMGNVAVLGWFYGACDFITVHANDNKHCYYSVRGSESHGGRFYNPKQKMDENGVLYVLDRNDYDGSSIAQKFIDLVNENMGENTDNTNGNNSNTNGNNSNNSTDTETQTVVNTEKTLSEQVTVETYTNANYQKVITAKTDFNGAFESLLDLNIPGKYSININYGGNREYNSCNTTVTIENYKGTYFNPVLLQTTITNKYTDGTTDTSTTGSINGEKYLLIRTTTRTYKDGVLGETKVETETTNGIDIVTNPATTQTTTTTATTTVTPGNTEDPFVKDINTVNGVPNVAGMSHDGKTFAMVDLNKAYTLTKAQLQEVIDRDSKSIQLHNYIESKYTAFRSETMPNQYTVLERERWNAVEESIYYKLVKGDGKNGLYEYAEWPQSIVIDFKNHTTKFDGTTTINWKAEKCTYHFVADDQDLGRSCGPTACSVTTQILHRYFSEKNFEDKINSKGNGGSGPLSHRSALRANGFTAEECSGITASVNWLKTNRPVVYHTNDHYLVLADISEDGNKLLVCNGVPSATDNSFYGPHSGWRAYSNLKKRAFGVSTKVGLNWIISEEEKKKLQHFYKSMGGAWSKPANTNESVRMFVLSGY